MSFTKKESASLFFERVSEKVVSIFLSDGGIKEVSREPNESSDGKICEFCAGIQAETISGERFNFDEIPSTLETFALSRSSSISSVHSVESYREAAVERRVGVSSDKAPPDSAFEHEKNKTVSEKSKKNEINLNVGKENSLCIKYYRIF